MKLIIRTLAICLAVSMIAVLPGCSGARAKQPRSIIVFADIKFEKSILPLADKLYKEDHIKTQFDFEDSQTLSDRVRSGEAADLLVLNGMTVMDKLQNGKFIDNYKVFAREKTSLGTARYTIAKPLRSRKYADAQTFADLILSREGQKLLIRYGYLPA